MLTRHISIDCFGISIDSFGLSRVKKWMILIKPFLIRDQTFSNFLVKTISVVLHSVTVTAFASRFRHIRKAVSSDQPAQKKCKTNSGKFSRISATVVEAV